MRSVPALFLTPVVLAALACRDSTTPPRAARDDRPARHVLLISLDTLRADHMGLYGYPRPTTPFLDELAERGVVFDAHFANSNCTLPSHASMLTGLHYATHSVWPGKTADQGIRVLASGIVTLAERFQDAGYTTRALANHEAWLNEDYGFDQGFDEFRSAWKLAPETIDEYLASLDRARAEGRGEERSFDFLHFFDVHSDDWREGPPCMPYQSSEALALEFAGPRPEGFTGCVPGGRCSSWYLKALSRHRLPIVPEHLEYLVGLYDAGIAKLDADLRRLFEELEARGRLDETLVVITADHGEEFFEHEKMLHDGVHDEITRVPWIVVPPRRMGIGPRRVRALTQSTQVAPTLLDLAGLDPIGQSASLAGVIMGGAEPKDERVIFHQSILLGRDEGREFKLWLRPGGVAYFDRKRDPAEHVDLARDPEFRAREAERLERLEEELRNLLRTSRELGQLLREGASDAATLSPERRAELEALGYF